MRVPSRETSMAAIESPDQGTGIWRSVPSGRNATSSPGAPAGTDQTTPCGSMSGTTSPGRGSSGTGSSSVRTIETPPADRTATASAPGPTDAPSGARPATCAETPAIGSMDSPDTERYPKSVPSKTTGRGSTRGFTSGSGDSSGTSCSAPSSESTTSSTLRTLPTRLASSCSCMRCTDTRSSNEAPESPTLAVRPETGTEFGFELHPLGERRDDARRQPLGRAGQQGAHDARLHRVATGEPAQVGHEVAVIGVVEVQRVLQEHLFECELVDEQALRRLGDAPLPVDLLEAVGQLHLGARFGQVVLPVRRQRGCGRRIDDHRRRRSAARTCDRRGCRWSRPLRAAIHRRMRASGTAAPPGSDCVGSPRPR